jgi:hypothetical protein
MSNYNGWTNYATWRVNLEMFDGYDPYDCGHDSSVTAYDLGLSLKEMAAETLEAQTGDAMSLAFSYAMAFLSDVNWTEIAQHMIDNYSEQAA